MTIDSYVAILPILFALICLVSRRNFFLVYVSLLVLLQTLCRTLAIKGYVDLPKFVNLASIATLMITAIMVTMLARKMKK
jgi:hypothetical protein